MFQVKCCFSLVRLLETKLSILTPLQWRELPTSIFCTASNSTFQSTQLGNQVCESELGISKIEPQNDVNVGAKLSMTFNFSLTASHQVFACKYPQLISTSFIYIHIYVHLHLHTYICIYIPVFFKKCNACLHMSFTLHIIISIYNKNGFLIPFILVSEFINYTPDTVHLYNFLIF